MPYRMRFLVTDTRLVSLDDLAAALQRIDRKYSLHRDGPEGTLEYSGTPVAALELDDAGDDVFGDELSELKEAAGEVDGKERLKVLEALETTRQIVAVQVLFGEGETEEVLSRLDPLWAWLFRERGGLLQADGEGYYDAEGLILEVQ